MDKLEPIKQPTDSRIRPLSDYSDKIEIREVEQWESGTIQEFLDLTDEEMAEIEKNCQHNKLSTLPWKVDGLCIYDADDHMVAEIKAAHWMTPEQVFANAQYIADALQLKQEMAESEKNFQKFRLTPDDVAEIMSEMRNTPCLQCNGTGLMKVYRGEPSQGCDEVPCDLCLEGGD